MDREFDLIVYGATGYTGQLVAEYLARHYPTRKWAMAGRSRTKLEAARDAVGASGDLPLITANADDPASLKAMCERTRAIITTVGPYQLYGEPLLAACAQTGTHYLDLCGEPAWMRQMIDKYDAQAANSGARILLSCGFDSIPFDLGVWTLQQAARAKFGRPAPRVKGRIRKMQGTVSGGTFASARATMAAAARDPGILKLMIDPFALTPDFRGPAQPKGLIPEYDAAVGGWVAPFVMAAINTKNVHRTNALLGHAYGTDFVYDEMMIAPGLGDIGKAAAEAIAKMNPIGGDKGPKPGEGPTPAEREAGFYDILFIGEMPDGDRVESVVTGDMDPGYGSTSKMIAETALCLLDEQVTGTGGIWTPTALMAEPLQKRLSEKAGLTFTAG